MKKLTSVFTENMDCCIYTGSYIVERHRIFGGSNRKKSEKYGFVVPLRPDFHPNGVHFNRKNGDKHIMKSISVAGKSSERSLGNHGCNIHNPRKT